MPSDPPSPPSELTRAVPTSAPGSARILWLLALLPILLLLAVVIAGLGADEY